MAAAAEVSNSSMDSPLLRRYQLDASYQAIAALITTGRALVSLPTGMGKTWVLLAIAQAFLDEFPDRRVLLLAHREELLRQTAVRASRLGLDTTIEQADASADKVSPIVLATVQSLSKPTRLQRFSRKAFSLVIVDEAHHAICQSYLRIATWFEDAKLLGATATPFRSDRTTRLLHKLFGNTVLSYSLVDAIRDGWLVNAEYTRVVLDKVSLDNVAVAGGDLSKAQLESILATESAIHGVAKPLIELAGDRRTIVFCTSVNHAQKLAEVLNRYKPRSATYADYRDVDHRRRALRLHRNGEVQFLANCTITTEGYDDPAVSCIALARPTRSRVLYTQMIGRGFRPSDSLSEILGTLAGAGERLEAIARSDKPNLLILDFCGRRIADDLITLPRAIAPNDALADSLESLMARASRSATATTAGAVSHRSHSLIDDVRTAAEAAREREQAEALARKNISATVEYHTIPGNPFRVLQLKYCETTAIQSSQPITEKTRQRLARYGVPDSHVRHLSEPAATSLLAILKWRRQHDLCTYRMASVITKYGFSPLLTFKQAMDVLNDLARHNWRWTRFRPNSLPITVSPPDWLEPLQGFMPSPQRQKP